MPIFSTSFTWLYSPCRLYFVATPLPHHLLLPRHFFALDDLLLHYFCTAGVSFVAIAYQKRWDHLVPIFQRLYHDCTHIANPNSLPPLSPTTSSTPERFLPGRFTSALLFHWRGYINCHGISKNVRPFSADFFQRLRYDWTHLPLSNYLSSTSPTLFFSIKTNLIQKIFVSIPLECFWIIWIAFNYKKVETI